MSTQIRIFPPFTAQKKDLIKLLRENGYETFVDAEHKENTQWVRQNAVTSYFFELVEDEVVETDELPDIQLVPPEMDGAEKYIKWFDGLLNGIVIDVGLPKYEVQVLKFPDINIDQGPSEYELSLELVNDVMFYEVIKPHVDLPYVTVVHKFETNGHLRFFTNLFVCNSWGICREDVLFLKNAWGWLEMDGEFDLDSLMKDATRACFDGEIEPTVWRKGVKDVLELFNKRSGFY